uniref:Uncharacterized protein n=1 Tax=Helianthus annuus TaxID=4232 RepID=A0A251VGM5_HELAN
MSLRACRFVLHLMSYSFRWWIDQLNVVCRYVHISLYITYYDLTTRLGSFIWLGNLREMVTSRNFHFYFL